MWTAVRMMGMCTRICLRIEGWFFGMVGLTDQYEHRILLTAQTVFYSDPWTVSLIFH